MLSPRLSFPFFKRAMVSKCFVGFWLDFEKLGPIQGHVMVVMCRPLDRDVTILLVSEFDFLNSFFAFMSPMDIGCISVLV